MSFPPSDAAPKRKPVRSTWVVAALAVLFLAIFLTADGGFSMWLLLMGLVLLLTAGYSLVFRRTSWARLASAKASKIALAAGAGLAVVGFVSVGLSGVEPASATADATATASPAPSRSASPSPTATPTPTRTSTVVAGAVCPVAGKTETVRTNATPSPTASRSASPSATPTATPTPTSTTSTSAQAVVYTCTEDDNQKLIWMDKDSSDKLLADRKEAKDKADQAEADRVAAEAEAAENQRIADEAAAAQRLADEQAAAQRLADEQAAAAEAQRLAEEQARQYVPPAPVPAVPAPVAPPAPAPSAYYKNCAAARAAGAAPVYIGQPGYGSHLDRDGDGVGCE